MSWMLRKLQTAWWRKLLIAVAEKVSAFKTEAFFQKRAALSSREKAEQVLRKVRKVPPIAGDER
jgi:hypothetical protein